MSKVLIVKAHPLDKEHSSTTKLLEVFMIEYYQNNPGDSFEVIDVFDHELPSIDEKVLNSLATPAHELSIEQQKILDIINQYTQQFLDSDKIVIANPLWNYMVPSHLKQWIDTIVQPGKTFDYTPQGKVTFCDDKKVVHLQSNGSPSNCQDLACQYIDTIFKFIGVTDIKHICIDGKDIPNKEEQAIKKAHIEAIDFSKEF